MKVVIFDVEGIWILMEENRKVRTESFVEILYRISGYLLEIVVCAYMLLMLVGLPFYNEEGFTHIGTDKAMFFRDVAIKCGKVLLPVLLCTLVLKLLLLHQKKVKFNFKEEFSHTDYFAFAYGVAVVLSYFFSVYKDNALWGTSGWYMGTIPQLILVTSYFLVSRVCKQQRWIILLIFPVSTVVFGLGYLNRFGIYPIDMQIENPSFISTIGNINWYCGYLVSVFFAGAFLLWVKDWEKRWQKLLLMFYVVVGYATLVTHGSSSGIVAMAGIILVLFCMSVSDGKRMEAFWMEMCLLSLACVITCVLRYFKVLTITFEDQTSALLTDGILPIVITVVALLGYIVIRSLNNKGNYPEKTVSIFAKVLCGGIAVVFMGYVGLTLINTLSSGAVLASTAWADSNMFTFSPEWGSNRGATWVAGVYCFLEQDLLHKLVGVGPDSMPSFLYGSGSDKLLAIVNERFGMLRLTNAHNEWLTILVNSGLLGFVSYAGLMVTAIKRYISVYKHNIAAAACGFCLLAYTINNMFSFQQSMSAPTIFIILAVGESFLRTEREA